MRIRILGNVESGYDRFVAGDECEMRDRDAKALINCKMAELCEEKVIEPQEQKEGTIEDKEISQEIVSETPKKVIRRRRKKVATE
jgi:hypothetical protein